jgi:diaminopropionate ammonia-lyase
MAGYAPTALHLLHGLTKNLNVSAIYYKDESIRFGLGNFKVLGGAHAVLCLLQQELSKIIKCDVSFDEICNGSPKVIAEKIGVAAATDGNHGRSVSWDAEQFGCGYVIYIHAEVSEGRKAVMEEFRAAVTRVDGNYDVSVHRAASDAEANGWFIVSDTSYPGYVDSPKNVAAGYAVFIQEMLEVLATGDSVESVITHVFVQGGVGGLASAVCLFMVGNGCELPLLCSSCT